MVKVIVVKRLGSQLELIIDTPMLRECQPGINYVPGTKMGLLGIGKKGQQKHKDFQTDFHAAQR